LAAERRPDRYVVGPAGDIPPGERRLVDVNGLSLGVFNVGGTFYALHSRCPHRAAPVCMGGVSGTNAPSGVAEFDYGMEGRVLKCPWHGWEFDLATGQSYFDPSGTRVRSYPVTREKGPYRAETVPVAVEEELVVLLLRRRP